MRVFKRFLVGLAIAASAAGLVSCGVSDANVVDKNISTDADNFKVLRRVVFINTVDGSYLLEVIGFCNINDQVHQIETICKTGDTFKKHFMGLKDMNVTYVAEQIEGANVSASFYKFTIKPSVLIPNVEIR